MVCYLNVSMLVMDWRGKNHNQMSITPRHGTLLFTDQDDVDNYVKIII